VTEAEYFALPATSWTRLKNLRRSALAYKHALENERPDGDALRLGRATHCATLEPDQFPLRYLVWDQGPRRGKAWDEFSAMAAAQGKTVLKLEQYQCALAIRDAVRRHPVAARYLEVGEAEKVITWTDFATGIECKAKCDWVAPGRGEDEGTYVVLDLKTARHATSPKQFASAAYELGYYGQGAHYTNGVRAVTGREARFVMVAVEPVAPHDVAVYRVEGDPMAIAKAEVRDLLERLARCRAEDKWPGRFEDEEQLLALPRWAVPDMDDVETVDPEWAEGI
jgi:hypothetical protein